ncbi:sulfite exporter TauE/SafE family protein [Pseudomonadota bacterium]
MLQTILADVGIDSTTLLLMLLAAFLTAVFHSVSGLAGALLLVIILAPFLGIKTAVPLVSVAIIISNITRLWVFRRELNKPIFLALISTALPGMVVGALMFVYLPVKTIALLLAIFLTISVPGRRLLKNQGLKVGRWGFAVIGPVYGLISGVTMGAGLFLAPFFLGAGIVGGRMIAMTAALGISLNITKATIFSVSPLLNFPMICVGLLMGLCTIPGAYVGRWILHRTSIHVHTTLVEMVIIAGAVFFFSQAFST